jgi:hypothetical protein
LSHIQSVLAVVFIVFWAMLGLAWLQLSEQSPPNNRSEPPKAEQQNGGASVALANDKQHAKGKQEGKWWDTFAQHPAEWLIAVFNALLVYVTYRLVISTNKLWEATNGLLTFAGKQAEDTKTAIELSKQTLIAGRRAWIRRDRIAFSSPLIFREDGLAHAAVSFEFTNVGNTPALHIQKFAWLLTGTAGATVPEARAKALFEKARRQPVSGRLTLFPGQAYPRYGQTPVGQGVVLLKEEVDAATDDAGRVSLYLAAGINYAFASDPTNNHQTTCLFEVQSKSFFISRDRKIIPTDDLRLDESGFLGMDSAD